MDKVTFISNHSKKPNVKIVGNYWEGKNDISIILLHMMLKTKESWNEFGDLLNSKGYHVLAIDLRGHGESTVTDTGEKINYKNFSDEENQATTADVEAAREFLESKRIKPENIFIGGASIGANLSIEYIAEHKEAPGGFMLSPGLTYFGINTELLIKKITDKQKVFLISADDDTYSRDSVRALSSNTNIEIKTHIYNRGGHGTRLFQVYPELMNEIISWISD